MTGNVNIRNIRGSVHIAGVQSGDGDVVISNIVANGTTRPSRVSASQVELPEGYRFDPTTSRLHVPDSPMITGMSLGVGPGMRASVGSVTVDGFKVTIGGKTFDLGPPGGADATDVIAEQTPAVAPAPMTSGPLSAQLAEESFDSGRKQLLDKVLGAGSVPPVDEWSAIVAAHDFDSGKLAALAALLNASPDSRVPAAVASAITAAMSFSSGVADATAKLKSRIA